MVAADAERTRGESGAGTSREAAEVERYGEEERRWLLTLARRAIETGLAGAEEAAAPEAVPWPQLRAPRATFVTLHLDGQLRGCIGSLEPDAPLYESVWRNARKAAFGDPRFPPVTAPEARRLELHVSVLSPLEPLEVRTRTALLERLRPRIDGLVIEDGPTRATFLPDVWDALPTSERFVVELMRKAGLPDDHWSPSLRSWRYTTTSFGHPPPGQHDSARET